MISLNSITWLSISVSMSKKVAVIASILKPVNDIRMYQKLGRSIRETNKYRVNIIGFAVKKPPVDSDMEFHTLYQGKRASFDRLLAPLKFFRFLVRLKPELLIICTPELLIPATFYRLFFGVQLWYDVQENYSKNVRFQSVYPAVLKPILRVGLWTVEVITYPFVEHFLLAEKGYVEELKFSGSNYTVLENKAISTLTGTRAAILEPIKLIFTGTLSLENGILEAISFIKTLRLLGYPCQLTIIGYAPGSQILTQIKQGISGFEESIELIGGDRLVPHRQIMRHLEHAHFGLVCHRPNPSNENCIPTKLYEYLALELPILLQKQPLWESVAAPYQAAVVFDFAQFDAKVIWEMMMQQEFYLDHPGPEVTWEQESQKLKLLYI